MYYLWFLVCKKILSSFRGVIEKTQNSRILAPFWPQKVFLLPNFLLVTKRPWASGDLIRALCCSKKYFFPACLLLTFYRICIDKLGPKRDPKMGMSATFSKAFFFVNQPKNTLILIFSQKTDGIAINKKFRNKRTFLGQNFWPMCKSVKA